jgi:hypothetical protein
LPANLVGKNGSVNLNVIDAEAPALLGMDFLKKANAVVDFGNDTAVLRALSSATVPSVDCRADISRCD